MARPFTSAQTVLAGEDMTFTPGEEILVATEGVLEVVFVSGDTVNYGTVTAGTVLPIAIRGVTKNNTANIIVHR